MTSIEVTDITDFSTGANPRRRYDVRHSDITEPLVVEVPFWATGDEVQALISNAIRFRLEHQTEHRNGCASSRNRPCTCEYLAQWDSAGEQCVRAYDQYAAKIYGPGVMVMPDGMVEDYIRSADLTSATMPIVITESEYNEHGLRVLNDPTHRWVPGDQLPPHQTGR